MSDLVERLRDWNGAHPRHMHEIADLACTRIEQLERELEAEKEAHKTCEFMMQTNASVASDLSAKLAAEKALADRLYPWVHKYAPVGVNVGADEDIAAYRKARGL